MFDDNDKKLYSILTDSIKSNDFTFGLVPPIEPGLTDPVS